MLMKRILVVLFSALFLSCNSTFTPKPKSYFKIDLPQRAYKQFDSAGYPFTFEYPTYARISNESDGSDKDPYWINVNFDEFNGRIYLSYKNIGGKSVFKLKTSNGYRDSSMLNTFEGLREESYKLTYKHTVKSSGIVDSLFATDFGAGGVYFYVEGNAATSRQFFITDTSKNFIRGALYFDASPNADSISVVSDFLDADMKHLIKTFRFKH